MKCVFTSSHVSPVLIVFCFSLASSTASDATAIGNVGKGLDTLCLKKVLEYHLDQEKTFEGNEHTERGNELEPIARDIYEMETGNDVQEVGFVEYSEFAGCSPDGLVGEEGGIEIKSISNEKYAKVLLGEDIKKDYDWQVQMNLLCTGRKWWDLVIYNPNFKDNIKIYRIEPDEDKHQKLLDGIEKGEQLIKQYKEKLGF